MFWIVKYNELVYPNISDESWNWKLLVDLSAFFITELFSTFFQLIFSDERYFLHILSEKITDILFIFQKIFQWLLFTNEKVFQLNTHKHTKCILYNKLISIDLRMIVIKNIIILLADLKQICVYSFWLKYNI